MAVTTELILVLKENAPKAFNLSTKYAEWGDVHKLPFEQFYLLTLKMKSTTLDLRAKLKGAGIAYNWHRMNGLYDSERFDHMGEATEQLIWNGLYDQAELLYSRAWPDGVAARSDMAKARSELITMRYNWDNQLANGQLYTMMRLLGAEE